MYEHIIVEKKGRVGVITINRKEVKNAFDEKTRVEFRDAIREFRNEKSVRVIVITGTEGSFSAGQDLKSVAGVPRERVNWLTDFGRLMLLEIITGVQYTEDPAAFFESVKTSGIVRWSIGENWKPVIAQINGYALGGGFEIACACDFRFAAKSAILGFPEVDMRIFSAWGGTQFSVAVAGVPIAKYMNFTGERISAEKAMAMGFLHGVFDDGELAEQTMTFARALAQKHLPTLRQIKILLEQSRGEQLIRGLALEHDLASKWESV
nr:enoyl-CoA hydratase/isomerase family protein [Candidatus Sigynarchaeota archaeon]